MAVKQLVDGERGRAVDKAELAFKLRLISRIILPFTGGLKF